MAPQHVYLTLPVGYSLRGKDSKESKARYQEIVKAQCAVFNGDRNRKYKCTMSFHSNWYTKKGKIKKKDAHNYASTLVDIVCEALGIDDSQIFQFTIEKVHSENHELVSVCLQGL